MSFGAPKDKPDIGRFIRDSLWMQDAGICEIKDNHGQLICYTVNSTYAKAIIYAMEKVYKKDFRKSTKTNKFV